MRTLMRYAATTLLILAGGMGRHADADTQTAPGSAPVSGIDTQYEDASVRPQDDTYRYLNGKWLDEFQIPADKGRYSSFDALIDRTQDQLRAIVDDIARIPGGGSTAAEAGDADARKLADLYASFMDEARLETQGLRRLSPPSPPSRRSRASGDSCLIAH